MQDAPKKINKILAFCYEFPPIGGGAGNALFHLCKEWVRQGVSVTVITSSPKQQYLNERIDGIQVIRLNVGRREIGRGRIREMIRYMWGSVREGTKVSREIKPDLNVAFMTLPSAMAPWILSNNQKIPYVCELRGGDVPGFDEKHLSLYHRGLKPLIGSIWNRAVCLIANGSGLQQLAERTFRSRYVPHIIPNGVDSDYFKPVTDKVFSGDVLSAVAVGRLVDSQKNFSELIRIFSQLSGVWTLNIVGDGPDMNKLKRYATSLKAENIQFSGWKDKGELLKEFQQSDCYVSASRYEGMPNTALEAMAVGLPLVLSDIGGHQELVGEDNGVLFDLHNSQMASDFLKSADDLSDRLKKMSVASRERAVQQFQWKDVAIARLKLYEESLQKRISVHHG